MMGLSGGLQIPPMPSAALPGLPKQEVDCDTNPGGSSSKLLPPPPSTPSLLRPPEDTRGNPSPVSDAPHSHTASPSQVCITKTLLKEGLLTEKKAGPAKELSRAGQPLRSLSNYKCKFLTSLMQGLNIQ